MCLHVNTIILMNTGWFSLYLLDFIVWKKKSLL